MKKNLFIFIITTIFFSCQKEVSFSDNPSNSPNGGSAAVFTFSGSPNACTNASINGSYIIGTTLSSSNTVSIQVNVTTKGTYTISTATVNGYKFSASGTFTSTGVQTINLSGSGTPVAAQTNTFTPASSGISGCTFTVTVTSIATPAVYTLSGAPNACTVATVNGTYSVNTALTSANTVSVQVNVTSLGTYTISTNTAGGMTFSKSGSFTATGVQNVTLNGTGTPTTAGAIIFTVGSAGCTFSVTVAGPAVYMLSGAPGACTVATVNGSYAVGTALTASNTVTVQVNVTTIGSYNISTSTTGGMTFSKSGIFTSTGVQTIILNGSGTPTTSGANTFTVGSSGCTFSITVSGPAVYTFSGAPGACTVATINGSYTQGTALTASNTVAVQVNVTTIGGYNISTSAGGMTFSKSGTFTTTGVQSVTLNGTGTPTTSGSNTFTVGSSGCTFTITVTAGSVGTGTYSCKIDGVFKSFSNSAEGDITDDFFSPPVPYLYLDGYDAPFSDPIVNEFQIFITKNDNSQVTSGTYNVDGFLQVNGYRLEIDYTVENPDGSTVIWNTSSTLFSPNPPFTVVITSITSTRVKGTFSGTLTDPFQGSTHTKAITEGVFDLPIH